MTQNQVGYLGYLENRRHNKEMEDIERQQIQQRERESKRAIAEKLVELGVSSYHQSVAEAENQRYHNLGTVVDLLGIWEKQREANATLEIEQQKADNQTYYYLGNLMETNRHNIEVEGLEAQKNDISATKVSYDAQLGAAQLNEKSREYENTYNLDLAKFEWGQQTDKWKYQLQSDQYALDLLEYDQKYDEMFLRYGVGAVLQVGNVLGNGLRAGLGYGFNLDSGLTGSDVIIGSNGLPAVIS